MPPPVPAVEGREVVALDPSDLEALRRGELRGLEAVFRSYGKRVYRTCLHLLGQAADAEDAAQEVFLRVFDKAAQFCGRSSFATWLYRITVNHCVNLRRARREWLTLDGVGCSYAADRALRRCDDRDLLQRLLGKLPLEARAVLVLREIEELSYREIAEVLRIPEGTVMSRLSRARSRLNEIAEAHAAAEAAAGGHQP